MNRGGAAAATWIVRGGETPRLRRGNSVETGGRLRYREAVVRGQVQALWPELGLLEYNLHRHGPLRVSCK